MELMEHRKVPSDGASPSFPPRNAIRDAHIANEILQRTFDLRRANARLGGRAVDQFAILDAQWQGYEPNPGLGRQRFIEILRAAPHLTELNVNVFLEGDISLPETTLLVSHSKLQTLRLKMQYFAANGVPLGVHLDAPALHEITLYSLKRHATVNEPSFLRNWDAPTHLVFPPLEEYDAANVAELIRYYPGVETLEVEGKNIDTLFIYMHTILNQITPETSLPLPKLSTLHIADSDLRGETLLKFLDARLRHVKGGAPGMRAMTKVVMYETPGVTPEDWRVVNERLEERRRQVRNFEESSIPQNS